MRGDNDQIPGGDENMGNNLEGRRVWRNSLSDGKVDKIPGGETSGG
jgi:hypothetical protein